MRTTKRSKLSKRIFASLALCLLLALAVCSFSVIAFNQGADVGLAVAGFEEGATPAAVDAEGIVGNITDSFTEFITGIGGGIVDFFQTLFVAEGGGISILAIVMLSFVGLGIATGIVGKLLGKF